MSANNLNHSGGVTSFSCNIWSWTWDAGMQKGSWRYVVKDTFVLSVNRTAFVLGRFFVCWGFVSSVASFVLVDWLAGNWLLTCSWSQSFLLLIKVLVSSCNFLVQEQPLLLCSFEILSLFSNLYCSVYSTVDVQGLMKFITPAEIENPIVSEVIPKQEPTVVDIKVEEPGRSFVGSGLLCFPQFCYVFLVEFCLPCNCSVCCCSLCIPLWTIDLLYFGI